MNSNTVTSLLKAIKQNIISYDEMSMILVKRYSFSHDISHCNPTNADAKCHACKRYIAHIQLRDMNNYDKFRDGLYSYLSEPQTSCIDKDFKMFVSIP